MNKSNFTENDGFIEGTNKDAMSITSDWLSLTKLIDGVKVREVKNVYKETGYLTEIFRSDWNLDGESVAPVFQVTLMPGGISAWHVHQLTIDRIFINSGIIKIVLYDSRTNSKTFGMINEFRFGEHRPALVIIPKGVYHGVQNLSNQKSSLINLVDKAYQYEDPDHWRLPLNTDKIPYKF